MTTGNAVSDAIIVWFRRDLRLHDNQALSQACEDGTSVIPVYIHAPEEEEPWRPGAASRWWLHHSLQTLESTLAALGSTLAVFQGDSLSILLMLCERNGATAVYWNRLYDPTTVVRDERVKTALNSTGIRTRSFQGYLLREPWEVMTGDQTPYKVFTPYSRAGFRLGDPPHPVERTQAVPTKGGDDRDDGVDSLRLLPRVHWDAGLYEHWQPGEAAAWRRVETFIETCAGDYGGTRDHPGIDGASRLSPHLHFGEISPRALWHVVLQAMSSEGKEQAAYTYLRQLLWRDFAHQLLFHFPHITEENFKPVFDAFPWREDPNLIEAWRHGNTGVPLIDAGMRELWHTGFMHNRVRMNVASYLTKNAGIHWRIGTRWFWDTLVDANLANNTLGWQWVAGSGPDAAPYFRIFNPVTQGRKFDPDGKYVRRWIPELSGFPDRYLHAPWSAPEAVRTEADVRLGDNYPEPILDLKQTRERALEDYAKCKRLR